MDTSRLRIVPTNTRRKPEFLKNVELLSNSQEAAFTSFLDRRGNQVRDTEIDVLAWLLEDKSSDEIRVLILRSVLDGTNTKWTERGKARYGIVVLWNLIRAGMRQFGVGEDEVKSIKPEIPDDPHQGTYTPKKFIAYRHRKVGHS